MIYVNVDVETTGLLPARHAMLSLGAVAHQSVWGDVEWPCLGEFSRNLAVPKSREWDLETADWWGQFPDALDVAMRDPEDPARVMVDFCTWVHGLMDQARAAGLNNRVAMVGYPIAFDHAFIVQYGHEFAPHDWALLCEQSKIQYGGVDLASLIMGLTHHDYHDAKKRSWPDRWTSSQLPHTHVAIEDAREQAYAFCQIMREIRSRPPE